MANGMKTLAVLVVLFLFATLETAAQSCESLQGATSDELVSYLAGPTARNENAECITLALTKLGEARYEPAIDTLVKFLDFRRPPSAREKQGLYVHIQSIDEMYPAARALEEIGDKTLPTVLSAITSDSTSRVGRENALFVWMEIQKSDSPKAVSLLRRELYGSSEAAAKRNLAWALIRAPSWCNPTDRKQCEVAAGERR